VEELSVELRKQGNGRRRRKIKLNSFTKYSEGRLLHKAGAACIAERFIGDLKMRKMGRCGSASDKRRTCCTSTVTQSD